MKKIIDEVAYRSLYCTAYVFSLLPMSVLYSFSEIAYVFTYHIFAYRKSVVIQNLSRSFPEMRYVEIQKISRRFYRAFMHHFMEMLKSVSIHPEVLKRKVELVGFEAVGNYLAQGKNVIACVGHCGNWEMLNILPSMTTFDTYAVYKPLRNKVLDRISKRFRSRFGVKLIPAKSVTRHILSGQNDPSLYLFLADQCPGQVDEKYSMTFLNQATSMFPGVEKLAKASNAVVVYINILQLVRGSYKMESILICERSGEVEKTNIIKMYANALEANIKEEPYSWLWTHKRWKR